MCPDKYTELVGSFEKKYMYSISILTDKRECAYQNDGLLPSSYCVQEINVIDDVVQQAPSYTHFLYQAVDTQESIIMLVKQYLTVYVWIYCIVNKNDEYVYSGGYNGYCRRKRRLVSAK